MLSLDSLVYDLIFTAGANPAPESLVEALGGEDELAKLQVLVPDMEDPNFEMQVSPTRPFRRRGEHRVMLVDDSVAPMREDPRATPIVPLDLRPAKEKLIAICEALGEIRLGRIFALGSWGDAVLLARSAVDLRALALLPWVLDPSSDVRGRRVAGQLQQAQFEEKILAYDKRIAEMDEDMVLSQLSDATVSRREEFLVVDVLEDDGTWDLRRSQLLEHELAAVEKFSLIPGAPSSAAPEEPAAGHESEEADQPPEESPEEPLEAEPAADSGTELPPLSSALVSDRVVVVFPEGRFNLEVAAALGKNDWSSVIRADDQLDGATCDVIYGQGAGFVAPLEYLSEVFVDGKPLSRPDFEAHARSIEGAKVADVHCPRFGPALLLDVEGAGRFISSERDLAQGLVELLRTRA
jgi:hypothetical protein